MIYRINEILTPYVEKNSEQKYHPVAVGKYGIRKREDIYKKDLAKDYSKNKVIRKDTLTIGMGSAQIDIGILIENEVYSVSPAYHTYKINTSIVDSEFLEWILKEMNPELSKLYMISSARQGKSVDFDRMMNHKINIPSLNEQFIIVEKLKYINNLIANVKENYKKMDELVKSQFIEMFVDPIINDKGWRIKELIELTDVRDGTHDSPKYFDSGYPFVTSKNLINGAIDFSTCQMICEDDYNHFNERSFVDDGDILMPMIGTIGGAIIVKKDREFAIKNVALIKFNKKGSLINRIFIHNILNSDSMNEFFNQVKKGGTQNFISLGLIRKIPTIVPPIELQNKFADFVQLIDKSKYFGGACYGIC